eukprot:CAMPEP_0197658752 /NCGR_PEP_ID=MMETSP1338-20131121/45420_1 /TAXON_ID=43686 ORGANISM="Pelagodinium beii, Strain RCC1491" /NCGR_SAMPLE_ID=MMETSP1338 /ASSEMBLY_ACC=CAM_ASM_000754 /LENGTH=75 /DNA_ID=CAMNT_0043235389 /DNA_START=260 /DNA_END=487 /DNA_ORIENTATION=+
MTSKGSSMQGSAPSHVCCFGKGECRAAQQKLASLYIARKFSHEVQSALTEDADCILTAEALVSKQKSTDFRMTTS